MRRLDKPPKTEFGFETLKGYMIAVIVLFHIIPLCAAIAGVQIALMPILFMIVNPMVIFVLCLILGVKLGFTWKMPVFVGVVFAPSVFMYYMDIATPEDMMYAVQTILIYTIVYFIFALIATAAGALLKKWL